MDELKKYIQQHTDQLDQDEPRVQVWQNIQHATAPVKKATTIVLITRWAAAACVLGLAGVAIWYLSTDKNIQPVAAITQNTKPKTQKLPQQKEPVAKEELTAKTEHPVKNTKSKKIIATVNNSADLAELNKLENSFTQVINLQRQKISSIPMVVETADYFNAFKVQIRQMEKDEKGIRSDIVKHGMSDVLLDQLINVYQQKLNVLKQLQIEMNKTNNRYKQNRGPVDSLNTYFLKL